MKYGKAIRTLRSARGLSQKRLAAQANLGPSHLSLLESGSRAPSTGTLEALAKALDVPVYLLMLLASENGDLRGISTDQADFLGKQLLNILTQQEAEPENENTADKSEKLSID